ncbi:MAG TPA: enoyl-CoA hydratase-related protein [Acidimicrobiales bacterium]|nr:enoyl-CoA hydratase-related protein [Acidimicrobiales bacterium]
MAGPDGRPELLFDKRGPVATLTLNRPERGNALTPGMHRDVVAAWAEVRDDPAVRVAVVTGAGDRHFCTGADLGVMAETGQVSGGPGTFEEEVRWSPRVNRVWKPVIAAVNGLVAGGGLHFVVDADIVVAADSAAFMDTHVNVGLVGATEMVGLARRLPLGSVLRMTLMGSAYRMPAARAHALGLVDELVPADALAETVADMAAAIARNSPQAMAQSLRAIWGSLDLPRSAAVERGWALVREHMAHPDFTEGPAAFVEGRPPRWTVDGQAADGQAAE